SCSSSSRCRCAATATASETRENRAPMTWNMADLFELVADAAPDRECLVSGSRRLDYRQLEERSNRLAHHLAEQGVGKDSHVGVYAYNCTEWMEAFLAAAKLRAAAVNVNFRYVEDELRYLFKDADLVALVDGAKFEPAHAWDLVQRERVNSMTIVGDAMARPLADALAADTGRWDTSSLMAIGSGGAPLSPTVKEQLADLLPNTFVLDSFGS